MADAFWSLLLADPFAVADYRDEMPHLGAGVWIDFGIERGCPFVREREGGR